VRATSGAVGLDFSERTRRAALSFTRRFDLTLTLTFEVPHRADLVDQVLAAVPSTRSRAWRATGLSTNEDHPRLLFQVSLAGFEER